MPQKPFGPRWLSAHLRALQPQFARAPLCVAFSGGADSTALLGALAALAPLRARLRAVHVDHGLQADSAAWAAHCQHLARQLGVPLRVHAVKIERRRGASLEAQARTARYAVLRRQLQAGEVLLTAHHREDQLETVLLQLLRGAGLPGLAAMPAVLACGHGWLCRPLLGVARAELAAWVQVHGLPTLEDPSNADSSFDRNYLRATVLPLILARWPGAAAAAARSARHAAEAQQLLALLGRADAGRAADGAALSVVKLRALDPQRRGNALRHWIQACGHPLPDARRLGQIAGPLLSARADANPEAAWGASVVQRHAGRLLLRQRRPAATLAELQWDWLRQPLLQLPGLGTLLLQRSARGVLDLAALPARVTVRPRCGGERLRPRPGGPSRALKTLLQAERIAPAERRRMPLLFAGDELLAAADRWVDAKWQAHAATRQRARLIWRPGD